LFRGSFGDCWAIVWGSLLDWLGVVVGFCGDFVMRAWTQSFVALHDGGREVFEKDVGCVRYDRDLFYGYIY